MTTLVLQRDHCSVVQWKWLSLVVLLLTFAGVTWAEFIRTTETSDRRIKISLSVFPRVVAVDNHFRDKLSNGDTAKMIFIYDRDRLKAEELKRFFLDKVKSVAGMQLEVVTLSTQNLKTYSDRYPTAYFITERLIDTEMYYLIKRVIDTKRILFSPFLGDVERGATAGISVTSRVKPYFNTNTLRKSGIEINALLMKLSKRYE